MLSATQIKDNVIFIVRDDETGIILRPELSNQQYQQLVGMWLRDDGYDKEKIKTPGAFCGRRMNTEHWVMVPHAVTKTFSCCHQTVLFAMFKYANLCKLLDEAIPH